MAQKTKFPKILLFFFLIPYLAVLLFTFLDFVMNFAYVEYYWVAEWMVVLPETVAYYLLTAMLYAIIGITACYFFFGKTWEKWTMAGVALLASFLLPAARYLVHHFTFGYRLTNLEMLDIFNEDVVIAVTKLAYFAAALLVILLEYAYYAWILREMPKTTAKFYSPKHPVAICMMVYFGALVIFSLLSFTLTGVYDGAAVLSIVLEVVINIIGFFIAVFSAHIVQKWNTAKA